MIRALVATAFVLTLVICGQDAGGQERFRPQAPSRSYSPSPTLSPYLDYFRAPQGPLDSYHEYVRPKIDLRNTLAQQDRQMRAQAQGLRALNNDWSRAQRTGTLAPTGTGAGFFNYSHFYPGRQR
jgi:hypothetical protein